MMDRRRSYFTRAWISFSLSLSWKNVTTFGSHPGAASFWAAADTTTTTTQKSDKRGFIVTKKNSSALEWDL